MTYCYTELPTDLRDKIIKQIQALEPGESNQIKNNVEKLYISTLKYYGSDLRTKAQSILSEISNFKAEKAISACSDLDILHRWRSFLYYDAGSTDSNFEVNAKSLLWQVIGILMAKESVAEVTENLSVSDISNLEALFSEYIDEIGSDFTNISMILKEYEDYIRLNGLLRNKKSILQFAETSKNKYSKKFFTKDFSEDEVKENLAIIIVFRVIRVRTNVERLGVME